MKSLASRHQVAIFVCDRQLLARHIVLGAWVRPQAYADGQALRVAVETLLTTWQPHVSRRRPTWRVLATQGVDHRLATRAGLDQLVTHAKACQEHGVSTVRAFHTLFGTWPTAGEVRARLVTSHPYVLVWANANLRKRGELRGRRGLLKTVKGRLWLAAQARRILNERWAALVDDGGAAWVFHRLPKTEPRVNRTRGRQ